MAADTRRASPPTHVTVWVGLGLALVGLLVAAYAYTGVRIYDIRYAIVAIVGAVLALAGILVSAWGRSIMAARAARSKRQVIHDDALKLAELDAPRRVGSPAGDQPPTVAEPRSKFRIALPSVPKLKLPTLRKPSPVGAEAGALGARASAPAVERLTLRCPQCATTFSAEGVRPIEAACPQCGFRATV